MKDPYRKFDQCLFCENEADSKEHIISKWIGRKLKPTENAKAPRWKNGPSGKKELIDIKASSPITGFTSQSVCTSCNTGWMHDIVDDAKPVLEQLIAGTFRGVLSIEDQLRLYRHFAIMGMVVDVETKHSNPSLGQMQRVGFARAKCPGNLVSVHIGRYYSNMDNPYFNIAFVRYMKGGFPMISKTISVVLGSLAVAIDLGDSFKEKPMGYREIYGAKELKWPPMKAVKDRHVLRLMNFDPLGRPYLPSI